MAASGTASDSGSHWRNWIEKIVGATILVTVSGFVFWYARKAGSALIGSTPATVLAVAVTLLILAGTLPLKHVGTLAQLVFAAVGAFMSAAGFTYTEVQVSSFQNEAQVGALIFILCSLGTLLRMAKLWISPDPKPPPSGVPIGPRQWGYEILHIFRTGRGREQRPMPPQYEWSDDELQEHYGRGALLQVHLDLMDITAHKKNADDSYFYAAPLVSGHCSATREVLEYWSVHYGPVERIKDYYRINLAYQKQVMDFAYRCHRVAGGKGHLRVISSQVKGGN